MQATGTLYSQQVGPDIGERELIDAFQAHGRLLGHKVLRSSLCAFIDFERVEDAASARAALHEAKFSNCEIRVEYKARSFFPLSIPHSSAHNCMGSFIGILVMCFSQVLQPQDSVEYKTFFCELLLTSPALNLTSMQHTMYANGYMSQFSLAIASTISRFFFASL